MTILERNDLDPEVLPESVLLASQSSHDLARPGLRCREEVTRSNRHRLRSAGGCRLCGRSLLGRRRPDLVLGTGFDGENQGREGR